MNGILIFSVFAALNTPTPKGTVECVPDYYLSGGQLGMYYQASYSVTCGTTNGYIAKTVEFSNKNGLAIVC